VLALHPNHDPGREGIVRAIAESGCASCAHLPREAFIGLLRRGVVLVGNSSSGLIECAALGVRCVNVGGRQAGRERPANVIDVNGEDGEALEAALSNALREPVAKVAHPYGDGGTGERAALVLSDYEPDRCMLIKKNTY
ncbi:MAG: UDP-N-acetylglucosamine 2-epimerase, partial [Planctomycetota bacterium]|jgi:UDP-N-acetylglucosamine 2-epimerase